MLDQLGDPRRVGHIGLAARHMVQVGRIQQPALHLALEQLPDRLPVAPSRLHPTRVTPKLANHSASSPSPAVVVVNLRVSTWRPAWLSGTRTQAVTESLCTSRPAQRSTSVSTCLPPPLGNRIAAIRRSLYQRNLSLVLAATVRGARGSHVRRISGLSAPRKRRRRPDDRTFSSVAGGRPRPWEAYQQSRATHCADRHFPRSLLSVRGEGMRA